MERWKVVCLGSLFYLCLIMFLSISLLVKLKPLTRVLIRTTSFILSLCNSYKKRCNSGKTRIYLAWFYVIFMLREIILRNIYTPWNHRKRRYRTRTLTERSHLILLGLTVSICGQIVNIYSLRAWTIHLSANFRFFFYKNNFWENGCSKCDKSNKQSQPKI